jgi:hypothetical protein
MGKSTAQKLKQGESGVSGKTWIDTFSRLVERLVTDAITTSVIL